MGKACLLQLFQEFNFLFFYYTDLNFQHLLLGPENSQVLATCLKLLLVLLVRSMDQITKQECDLGFGMIIVEHQQIHLQDNNLVTPRHLIGDIPSHIHADVSLL